MFEYKDGKVESLNFSCLIGEKEFFFRLPAMVENVTQIMFGSRRRGRTSHGPFLEITDVQKDQAYKTAWANIRDWIDAQMAMIDTQQVKMEEVMLPFLIVKGNKTLFQQMEESQFLLGNGDNQ